MQRNRATLGIIISFEHLLHFYGAQPCCAALPSAAILSVRPSPPGIVSKRVIVYDDAVFADG